MLFLLLEATSGVLFFRCNDYQGSIWFSQANAIAAYVHEWEAMAFSYFRMPAENAALVRRNVILQQNNDILRHQLALAGADTAVTQRMHEEQLRDVALIPAHIVDNSVRRKDNMIVIDAGSADGVAPEMGVVSGTGVVGIVSGVTRHHALVMSVLNSHSSISCRLRGTEYFGYLKWKGGRPLRAFMDDVPRHARIRRGDVVETSGFSNVFPAGIFLGKVAEIRNSSDGMAYELEVMLGTDLSNLRHVSVVASQFRSELDSLAAK